MLIDCPACARSYHVSRAEIGEHGRTVICPRCDTRWFVYNDGTTTLTPASSDLRASSFSARAPVVPIDGMEGGPRASLLRAARPVLAGAACLALAMAAIGARQHIVRAVPRLASLYATLGLPVNVVGLEIAGLTPERMDGADLTISGTIRNITPHRVIVPRLVYEVRDGEGASLETWTEKAPANVLRTGATLAFASLPHQLPAQGRTVLVRFEDADPGMPLHLARRTD